MVNSPVDPSDPDLIKFPRFARARALDCRVEQSDTLFVPSFWWHEVQSEACPISHRNVAVNLWFDPLFSKAFPCAECPLQFSQAYKHVWQALSTGPQHDEL